MRRAAIQVFRTARSTPVRRLSVSKALQIALPKRAIIGARSASPSLKRNGSSQMVLSSMRFPTYPFAALLVLLGGVYYYQDARVSNLGAWVDGNSAAIGKSSTRSTAGFQSARSAHNGDHSGSAETPPKTLLVENDQFYAGSLSEDVPLSKEAEDPSRQVLAMLTPEQATQQLRRSEESYFVGRGRGVVRYDLVQLPSNNPIEDDHAEKIVEVSQTLSPAQDGSSTSDWMFWGVFDGHSGWTTSAKLRQVLISYVARELNAAYSSALANPSLEFPAPEAVDTAIKKGFLRLDHDIIYGSVEKVLRKNSKLAAAEILAPAMSGACALLSFYDSRTKLLRVACTGDSRAVLGRRGPAGKWTATALSEDQTGATPSEMARLRAEHPGEEHVVSKGRILGGLEPTRAFGDSMYKWSKEVQDRIKSNFFGRTPSSLIKTPPYVTAEPVITTTKVEPERGDFVVMATDGLWEMLSNEEVIGLVGQWLESHTTGARGADSGSGDSWLRSWRSSGKALPVEKHIDSPKEGQRLPIRQLQWNVNGSDTRFVVEDENAATHVVRNALGGKDRDMVCALLTLPSPHSRRYRDDITVEVIFFGESDNSSGAVVQNPDASALRHSGLKTKL